MIVEFSELDLPWALNAASALEQELFGSQAWDRETVRQEVTQASRIYLADVVDSGNQTQLDSKSKQEPVRLESANMVMRGYAGMWHADSEAEIMAVGVAKRFQGNGIAKNLLNRLIRYACLYHVRRVMLEVRVDNKAAQRLYRGMGFRNIGLLRHYYQPENVDAIEMALDLQAHIIGFESSERNMERVQ
ncbi:ribosomal protein S18-alanine N-acetyltransferase [Bifidobacterium sp. ESL0745]|uniref:ribosomal protein S18-alanine N-acetyltransferase n=1 Tax=Bifidobacterium sp. ESL0745 TaxID=2983226 RepID=UPI0023F61AD4|nr:ribosomal protein S18-alanine N-acetyltransferase [Bifidobacterium sp. ESL0745]MDF7665006.1 ribosomal protein S18-alanine N-acetyltransferase [Bifidobacterium sp. ESL0745]